MLSQLSIRPFQTFFAISSDYGVSKAKKKLQRLVESSKRCISIASGKTCRPITTRPDTVAHVFCLWLFYVFPPLYQRFSCNIFSRDHHQWQLVCIVVLFFFVVRHIKGGSLNVLLLGVFVGDLQIRDYQAEENTFARLRCNSS